MPYGIIIKKMSALSNGKTWVEEAIDWCSTPKDIRIPRTAREFCSVRSISESTFYYEISKPDFQRQVVEKSLTLAKKATPDILEKLREKAEQGDIRSIEIFLKYVLRLGEKDDAESSEPVKVKILPVSTKDELERLDELKKLEKRLEKEGHLPPEDNYS